MGARCGMKAESTRIVALACEVVVDRDWSLFGRLAKLLEIVNQCSNSNTAWYER